MIQQRVQELLAEWRDAERRLEQADDPQHAAELETRVQHLREAYQQAIAAADESFATEVDPA